MQHLQKNTGEGVQLLLTRNAKIADSGPAGKHFYPESSASKEPRDLFVYPLLTHHYPLSFPRIMCASLQESTSCTIASSAAPDGTSVKLATACGDSPAGPAPTTPNRSTPSSAPSILAAISLTLRGLTAKDAANRSSEKFSAPTLERNSTSPQKFRPRTANGPAAAILRWTIVIRRTTSKRTSTKASPISASKNSISSSFILGKTAGSTTTASRARWKSCAPAAKPKPSASALIVGNLATAFAPCLKASPTPSRSSTTSSTRILKTRSSPSAA